jgi:cell division septal protein FtsQ
MEIFKKKNRETMTTKERDIKELKNKIEEYENTIKTANQNGPLAVAFIGIILCLFPVMGFGVEFFVIGLIIVLVAIVWAYFKTREVVVQKEAIFRYKMELYKIEKKP